MRRIWPATKWKSAKKCKIRVFFARCYGWGATSDYWLKIGDFAPTGGAFTQNLGSKGSSPTNHSFSQKTRLNGLSHGIKIWTDFSSVLSQCTHLTDGQTERILIVRPRLHSMQRGRDVTFVIHVTTCRFQRIIMWCERQTTTHRHVVKLAQVAVMWLISQCVTVCCSPLCRSF